MYTVIMIHYTLIKWLIDQCVNITKSQPEILNTHLLPTEGTFNLQKSVQIYVKFNDKGWIYYSVH